MKMQVFSARVEKGTIVPEDGVSLPEGTKVTVIADGDEETFKTTEEEERELLEAVAGIERGETVRAADVLERLRR
jgi:predicted DNA-binding antitoxin AbrB/MazE fold protein